MKYSNVVLGGRRRPIGGPKLHLRNYLVHTSLPTPPTSVDYSVKASESLNQMFGNDSVGDCVIAGGNHIVGVETGNAGTCFVPTTAQVLGEYSAITGYNPDDPNTDQGCNEQEAFAYWIKHGFLNGTKLLGWIGVDATNQTEVEQACYLFENLFFGIELPDKWINPFPSGPGFTWDVAGNPDANNGHCIVGVGYDETGVKIATWGITGTLTWNALKKYCVAKSGGELYVLLTPDQIGKGQTKAPNGINWSDLIADFNALGGHVPLPTPNGPVTLEQATSWAISGIKTSCCVLTKSKAISLVTKGLSTNWPKS